MGINKEKGSSLVSFQDILSNLPGYVHWKDSKGKYLGCNLEFARALSFSSIQEVVGKTDYDCMDSTFAKIICDHDEQVLQENKPLTFEEKIVGLNGTTSTYLSKKAPFVYDQEKQSIGILCVSVDISAQVESALKNKIYLENILSVIPGHIFWMDKEGRFLGCNDQQAKSVGFNHATELVGKDTYDVMEILKWSKEKGSQIGSQIKHNNLEVIESKQPKVMEEKMLLQGEEKTFLSHKAPLYDDQQQVIGVVGCALDITQLKKAEQALRQAKEEAEKARAEAEEANKAKSAFLENMRHDIRTPLTGLIGFAKLLSDEIKDPKKREYAENLVAAGQILLDFMNEILETIRVTSGQLPLIKQKFDLRTKLNEIILLNQAKARQKNLRLTIHFDKQIPHYLVGDHRRVARIVLELVTNALNFTRKGSVKVSVTLAKSNEQEKVIKIAVEDTGVGISPEKKEDIFIRFGRVNTSYEDMYRGAGLGLSVVKQFLDELGGEIYLESTPNKGSTFACLIPFKIPLLGDEEDMRAGVRPGVLLDDAGQRNIFEIRDDHVGNNNKKGIQKSHILVVEDDCLAARATSETLLKLNCRVDLAFNGNAALKLFQKNHYELVFMDIGMPFMDGYEITKRMRALEREDDHLTPIIGLTSHTEGDQTQVCLATGMNAVFTKPLIPEKAIGILNTFLFNNGAIVTDPSLLIGCSFMAPSCQNADKKKGKVIDIEETSKRIGLSPEKMLELLHTFIDNMENDLELMTKAYDERRWKDVAEMAHKFKGDAIYCGASRLKEVSEELENRLIAGKIEEAPFLYAKFLKEVKAVRRAVKKEIGAA